MKSSRLLLLSGIFASLGMLVSCVDDDLANGGKNDGDKGTAVTFNVSYAQDDAQNAMVTPVAGNTRAFAGAVTRVGFANGLAMLGLTPEDLTSQKLPVSGADNACLIETTTAGVYPSPVQVANAPQTRAQIATDYLPFFYTTGFCGTSPGNATTLWFHNADTNHDGTLVNPIHWSWDKPYGKFFAVAVVSSPEDPKIKPTLLFDKNTKPYINFEVKPNVFQQGDLMTACTDEVHYEKRFAAPIIPLKFRHALTAVRFKVGQNLSWNKTITKVEIIGAKSKGCYTLSTQVNGTGTWSVNPQDKGKTFTLDDVNVSTSAAVNHIIVGDNDNYTFYMIPQQLDGVSVKITFSDKSTISANLSGEWKAGTTKTYALSEKNSNWEYVLTVPPASVNTTTDIGYLVESYRRTHGGYVQYPVPWKVVNYQEIIDGIEGPITTEKPDWLTSLTMEGGKGSNIFEIHQATLQRVPAINKLAVYNKELQEAEERGTENDPYDLSMHNLEGKKTLRNTANCYLISAPGWYKIPLVYGNGVKNGKENLHSYQTMNTGGKFVLKRFTDHDNDVISTPYINCQSPTNFAEQADVVWTDQPGIVDNLSVVTKIGEDGKSPDENAYLKFHVSRENIKNGNAVIAVKNGLHGPNGKKGNIRVMWSWHLWFAQKDALETIKAYNHHYKFAKQPLGFAYRKWEGSPFNKQRTVRLTVEQVYGNGEKKHATIDITQEAVTTFKEFSSTLYQFGRKDAFPSISFDKNVASEHIADGELKTKTGDEMSVAHSIMYPELYYTSGTGWKDNYGYYNLWSMDNTEPDPNGNNVVKTIFDPCPVGFHVPASNVFNCFTINESIGWLMKVSGKWDQGWHFKKNDSPDVTLYFPALPCRDENGKLNDTSSNTVYYWTSNPFYNTSGYRLKIDNTLISCGDDNRVLGLPILPIAK